MGIRRIPSLSQCMIVKNEEKNIRRALSWGKDIVCEQIVVDTGSTDRTVEIAREMGAKVYFFSWIDDFAAAKNYAIDKATGEWIAFLDADEYVPEDQVKNILPFLRSLKDTKYNAVATDWMQVDEQERILVGGTQSRVFKRLPGLRYKGRIHEDLCAYEGEKNLVNGSDAFSIFHMGYHGESNLNGAKGKRNIPIILKELSENPEDPDMMGYLADSYQVTGDNENAEKWYREAISRFPDKVDELNVRISLTFYRLLQILADSGREEEFEEIYEQAIKKMPKEADFDYIASILYYNKGNLEKSVYHSERAVELIEKWGNANRAMALSGQLQSVWERLAVCYFNMGNLDKCVSCAIAVLKENPYLPSTLHVLIVTFYRAYRESGHPAPEEVKEFLGKLYRLSEQKDRIFLLRIVEKSGYGELAAQIRSCCTPEELSAFDRAVKR